MRDVETKTAEYLSSLSNKTVLTCDECSRPAMTMDPGKEVIRIESRHGGQRHVTVLSFQQLIDRLLSLSVKCS